MGVKVVLLGPPGAGKGTQAERLAGHYGVPKISTGDLLRQAMTAGTALGQHARSVVHSGGLVDDLTMIGLVRERLLAHDAAAGFVLDGFPRTVPQAEALDPLVVQSCHGPLIVVEIQVTEDEVIRRLSGRRVCGRCGANATPADRGTECPRCGGVFGQRGDDEESVVRARLAVYTRQTQPLVEYYRARGVFRVVDGTQAPEAVAARLADTIRNIAAVAVARR
jgi:adenylate kinase